MWTSTDFPAPWPWGWSVRVFEIPLKTPTPVLVDEINTYVVDLTPTANCFLAGHSIRINVMGSYFPFITRNHNTGSDVGEDTETEQAAVFVLHDFDYPSRIILPVIEP